MLHTLQSRLGRTSALPVRQPSRWDRSIAALFTEAQPMSIEENKAIVGRFLEALDQRNFDALKEHPDCIKR
jgi:hypothetical protein